MIEFKSVSKTFQRRAVLDDVTLSFDRGSRVALVGSNGAGKTTLIRCLLGEYVCQGTVSVNGVDPRADRQGVLSRIGFVPQLPPPLKIPVGELINFAASVCNSDPKHMEHVAQQLGLDMDIVRTQPFVKLSGGQKQKILIGIALGRETDVLVMDEPAASLDPESRKIFFNLLAERPEDTVMLMSSHRID
ncbi:MAG: ABC transporter ATP-binding protein, partial [Magnetovibrio sp.]|nr:ABC transporter ATP-binding protein [Magnetovibrio sp.]